MRDLAELHESGLLWLINRQVFHPRGYALALTVENGTAVGWDLLGDGTGPWSFSEDIDEALHLANAERTLRERAR